MAKFCPNCGNEMVDEAAMCVKCGTMVGENNINKNNESNFPNKNRLPDWAKALIILGCFILFVVVLVPFSDVNKMDDVLKENIKNKTKEESNITSEINENDYKSSCKIISYNDLARKPNLYKGGKNIF